MMKLVVGQSMYGEGHEIVPLYPSIVLVCTPRWPFPFVVEDTKKFANA